MAIGAPYINYLIGRPLTQITGMSQRDGWTFASLLNELYRKFDEEIPAEFDKFYEWVTELFDDLNNKVGAPEIQYVDLTADYTLTVNPMLPTKHDVLYIFTQNSVGGKTVNLGANIHGDVTVKSAPGAQTMVYLVPRGDGQWDAYTLDSLFASVIVSGSKVATALQPIINANVNPKIDSFTDEVTGLLDTLENEFDAFKNSVNNALVNVSDLIDASLQQVASKSVTYDELMTSVFFNCWREPGTNQAIFSSHDSSAPTFLTAPFNMRIIGFTIIFDRFDLATSDTNYLRMRLRKRSATDPDDISTIAEKRTTTYNGERIATRVPWKFDMAEWTEANRWVTAGETLALHWDFFGTAPQLDFPFTVIVRYAPF